MATVRTSRKKKATAKGTQQSLSRRQRVQHSLDTFRMEKAVALQAISDSFSSQVEVTLKQLQHHGRETEVNDYLELVSEAEKKNSPQLAKQVLLRGYSLRLLACYLTFGEADLFSELPALFMLDEQFCLQERWIQDLWAQWLRQGEYEKIERTLTGGKSPGRRDYKTIRELMVRDEKIVAAVKEWIKKGWGYKEAIRQVAASLPSLDILTQVSANAIQTIYHEWTKGTPGFVKYFLSLSPPK